MATEHCFKKVARPTKVEARPKSIRELVAKYGDKWALMAGSDKPAMAMWSTHMQDWTHDRHEAYDMLAMEKGEKCRCGE